MCLSVCLSVSSLISARVVAVDCLGVGVEKALPFFEEDRSLKEFGGLFIRDGHLRGGPE
jgi:hypothetical protein